MKKGYALEFKMAVDAAKRLHKESRRIRRDAAKFSHQPARDKMFFLAGEMKGRAQGYMRMAREYHPNQTIIVRRVLASAKAAA